MKRLEFFKQNFKLIEDCAKTVFDLHSKENKNYGILPYSVHLTVTVNNIIKYSEYLNEELTDEELFVLIIAGFYHDTLEDLSVTYNELHDIFLNKLNIKISLIDDILTLVKSLSTQKTGTRKERHSDSYYKQIRETKFASFIKMCDRVANLQLIYPYSINKLAMYQKESISFLSSLNLNEIPNELIKEYENLLQN